MTNDIILRVKRLEDLFYESVVPLSCKRLLHPDVEEFIIEEAEKIPASLDIRITIQLTEEQLFNTSEITTLIHRHFETKREIVHLQIKKILKLGTRSLLIGIAFLVLIFLGTTAITNFLPENALMITLRELFIILGWVALWRPADLLLFEWRPYKRNANLFDRIGKSGVRVIS